MSISPQSGGRRLLPGFLAVAAAVWLWLGPVAGRAQTRPAGAPDVLILVFTMPDGQDRLGLSYPNVVPRAQVQHDLRTLQQLTGWTIRGIKIIEARAPVAGARSRMTSVECIVPGAVPPGSHFLKVAPFVEAFRPHSRMILTYFLPPDFDFHGMQRPWANNDLSISLDRRGTAYTYQVLIRNPNFRPLSLPDYQAPASQTRSARAFSHARTIGLVALAAVAALGAACLVYIALTRHG